MTTYFETNRSPLNTSQFKQLYSFSRANRFTNNSYISPAPYYDNKIRSIGDRTTSFGYGKKMTFQSKQVVPPPNHYGKTGFFQNQVMKRRGFSFTHESNRNLIDKKVVGAVPGPGSYAADKTDRIKFKRVSFSFGSRYEDPLSRGKSPLGPGQYNTVGDIHSEGKYFLAKNMSSGCSKIGRSNRFDKLQTCSPGPGNYEDTKVTGFKNTGTYFNSTFKSYKANGFAHSQRKHIAEPTISPGPGMYNRFSDFPVVKKL